MASTAANGAPDTQLSRSPGHETAQEPPVKRRRKIGGPFKRSRTGCGTCKKRGKKCDENWTEQGFCQRCITGAWDCSGRTDGAGRDSQRGRTESLDTDSGSSAPPPPRPRTPGGDSSRGIHHQDVERVVPSNARTELEQQTPRVDGPSLSSDISRTSTTTWSNQYYAQIDATGPVTNPSTAHHPQPPPPLTTASTLGISPEASMSYSQPLFGWQNSSDPSSAFLNCFADGSLSIDSGQMDWSSAFTAPFGQQTQWNSSGKQIIGTSPLNDDLTNFFGPSTASHDALKTTAGNLLPANGQGNMDGAPRVVFVNNGHRPTRRGVSLAEIYARVVESWLVGLPSTTRDYARARILALNDNNSVMRAVRYAVATAYIFLYAADPQGGNDPQPKLVELAYQGAGVSPSQSYDAPQSDSRGDSRLETSTPRERMSKKLRLYVDTVSTPFSSDLESTRWTDDAIRELTRVVVKDKRQLSDLLWGVIDLQLVEFIRGGAAPSYDMLALGDRLVQAAYCEVHPTITLARLRSSDTLSLRLFAISDISRCIVHRKRRTLFNFRSAGTASQCVSEDIEEEPWTAYLGFQDPIVILLADVVNLCASMTMLSMSTVLKRAEEVEKDIRDWQPVTPPGVAGTDPTAVISRTIAGQLWRLCALILLYQSVHQVGILHPTLRKARSEMLSLLDSIVRLPNGDLWGFIGLPSFLAATLSTDESDRQRAMQHMMRPGPERMWLDNIALVEKVWEEMDETGRSVDWYDKMQREGMSVAFF